MWYENCKNPPYKNLMWILLAYSADRNKDYWCCLRSFSYAGTTLLRVVAKSFLSPLILPSLFLVNLPPTALPVVIYSLLLLALVPVEFSCVCSWLCCLSWSNRWPNWPSLTIDVFLVSQRWVNDWVKDLTMSLLKSHLKPTINWRKLFWWLISIFLSWSYFIIIEGYLLSFSQRRFYSLGFYKCNHIISFDLLLKLVNCLKSNFKGLDCLI